MTDIPPLAFDWDGEVMRPLSPKRADQLYVVGERYRLVPHEERSRNSHNHYFACIDEAWTNLPDDMADRFATPKHLRKWCLIKKGYRDERTIVCASKADALRVAAFIKPMDEYAVVVAREATVFHWKAKSQSIQAMGKDEFQKSKSDVLDELARLVGTSADTLRQNAGQAA